MAKKPPVLKLHELKPNAPAADCFALLIEKTKTTTREGKVLYKCRFKDARRTVECAVWSDAVLFADCEAAFARRGLIHSRTGIGQRRHMSALTTRMSPCCGI